MGADTCIDNDMDGRDREADGTLAVVGALDAAFPQVSGRVAMRLWSWWCHG